MIDVVEYYKKISKFSLKELLHERKKLEDTLSFIEKNENHLKKKTKDIYLDQVQCLIECLKVIKEKVRDEDDVVVINKKGMKDGDEVIINDITYKIQVVADKVESIKFNGNVIEVHVKLNYINDEEYVKKVYQKYKKKIM